MQAGRGIETSLPQIELLIDSSLTYSQRVARIGRRIFSFIASKNLSSEERIVSLSDFKEKYGDATMTDKELANCFRYLTRLVPEIGSYVTERQSIALRARPSLTRIREKIEEMESVTDEEFKTKLARVEKPSSRRIRSVKTPSPSKGPSLERWMKKDNNLGSSGFQDPFADVPEEMLHRFSL